MQSPWHPAAPETTSSLLATSLKRLRAFIRRERVAVSAASAIAGLSAVLLAVWTLRGPQVGLANNGDWYRYICPLGLVPAPDVSFSQVPEGLVAGQCVSEQYDSSFQLVLRSARIVDHILTGSSFSFRFLAFGWSAVATLGWGWLAFELVKRSARPLIPFFALALAVIAASDISFTAYYGSAYAEALMIALAPVIAAGVARLASIDRPGIAAGPVLLVATVLVSTAKPQFALTGIVVVAALTFARLSRARLPHAAAGGLIALACVAYSLRFLAAPYYEEVNKTNLMFSAVLAEADDQQAALVDVGLPAEDAVEMASYAGRGFWPVEVGPISSPSYDSFQDNVDRNAVLAFAATHPDIGLGMAKQSIEALDSPRLDYLANHTDPDRDGLLAARPAPATALLGWLLILPWWLVPVGWISCLWFAIRAARPRSGGSEAAGAVAILLVMTAGSQTALAVADGYYELNKHLIIGHYANALLVAALLGGTFGLALTSVSARFTTGDANGLELEA